MQQIQEFTQSATSTTRVNGTYEVGLISLPISLKMSVLCKEANFIQTLYFQHSSSFADLSPVTFNLCLISR